jgi:hypothetical protein
MSPSDTTATAKAGIKPVELAAKSQDTKEDGDEHASTCNSSKLPPIKLPLVSLSPGLRSKASPYTLQSWAAVSTVLDGRDNVTKIFQYASRLMVFCCSQAGLTTEASRFNALSANLSLSRKAFRLGRSLTEIDKLRKMSAFSLLMWHIRHANKDVSSHRGPESKSPLWKTLGSALKMLSLMGFFAGDNVVFLASAGFLDDFSLPESERTVQRESFQRKATTFANRAFVFGSIAGLFVAVKSYWLHRMNDLRIAQENLIESQVRGKNQVKVATDLLEKAQREQFSLFLVMLKSACDVILFSNNPGVDLFTKIRGKKNHEFLHCLCGIIGASTVLCSNLPDASY